jgi:hypothetical protein
MMTTMKSWTTVSWRSRAIESRSSSIEFMGSCSFSLVRPDQSAVSAGIGFRTFPEDVAALAYRDRAIGPADDSS